MVIVPEAVNKWASGVYVISKFFSSQTFCVVRYFIFSPSVTTIALILRKYFSINRLHQCSLIFLF